MNSSSGTKDKSPKYNPNKIKPSQSSLPPRNTQKESTITRSNNKPSRSTKKQTKQVFAKEQNAQKQQNHVITSQFVETEGEVQKEGMDQKKKKIQYLFKVPLDKINTQLAEAFDNLIENNITACLEKDLELQHPMFQSGSKDSRQNKQGSQSSRKQYDKAKTQKKIPSDKFTNTKNIKQPASSRSMGGEKSQQSGGKIQRQASIDLSKYDPDHLKKIVLSQETKQALMKLQRYDKQFKENVNNKFLRGVFDVQQKRQEKIKGITKSMKPIVFDNELTIGFILNILKYQLDLNKDVMEKELLIEKNQQYKSQIAQLKKMKNQEIKELKLSIKSKSTDEDSRNKGLDLQIKDFKNGNQVLSPLFKQGNFEKLKKFLEAQIKKLSTGNNKQIACERKFLLENILDLVNNYDKRETPKQRNTQLSLQQISRIHSDTLMLFDAQSSIQRNISHLEKTRRHLQPKLQDTKLFQFKDLYQSLIQGSIYISSLYLELKDKHSQIVSLNRKIADIQKNLQKTDRLRTQSIQKGDKIIQGLKDGLERQRKRSREFSKQIDQINRSKDSGEMKSQSPKFSPCFNQWQSTLDGIITRFDNQDFKWIPDLNNIKKRFSKIDQINYKTLFQKEYALLQIIGKKQKTIQKLTKSNLQLSQKSISSDKQLSFKPSDIQKKYQSQRQKNQQLLLQKNSLSKQLKQMHKQTQKSPKHQLDEVLSLNKVCFSIDSLLKVPFNPDMWCKIPAKLNSLPQLKYLNTIKLTLEALFLKTFQQLNKTKLKQPILKNPLKQLVKQKSKQSIQYKQISELFQYLKNIIDNQIQLMKYIDLVNYIPSLLKFLSDRLNLSAGNEDIARYLVPNNQSLQYSNQLPNPNDIQTPLPIQSQISLQQNSNIKQKQTFMQLKQQSNIQNQDQINLQLSDVVLRINYQTQYNKIKQQYSTLQTKSLLTINQLQLSLKKQQQKTYYKSKMITESELQKKELILRQNNYKNRIKQLEEDIRMCKSREILISNEIVLLKNDQKILREEIESLNMRESNQFLEENQSLKKELKDKENIIQISKETQNNLRNYIANLEIQISTTSENNLLSKQSIQPATETEAQPTVKQSNQPTSSKQLWQQNNSLRKDIHDFQIVLLQKDHQINNFYQLSQKYRLMFQQCCKQMQELHLNTQDQLNSLTEMHLRNQSLLEDQIQLLRKQKSSLNIQLKQHDIMVLQFQTKIKQQSGIRQIAQNLQKEREIINMNNQNLRENVSELEQEIIKLKQTIANLERESLNDSKPSNDKPFQRNPKFRNRSANKSNLSNSGCELSIKLANLLQKQQKLSKSSLQIIISAINKLISSNKKLLERVKRTERQNQALYQAINQVTEEDDMGQGISMVGQLQHILSNLIEWLDNQLIASQDDLKFSHYFQRLQDCISKTNYARYIQIFQQFIQNTIVVVYEKSQQQLSNQNKQIDSLKEKLMVALEYHINHNMDSQRQTDREQDQEGEGKVLHQVKLLLNIYLKTMNIKVIEDLVGILNIQDVSFG